MKINSTYKFGKSTGKLVYKNTSFESTDLAFEVIVDGGDYLVNEDNEFEFIFDEDTFEEDAASIFTLIEEEVEEIEVIEETKVTETFPRQYAFSSCGRYGYNFNMRF